MSYFDEARAISQIITMRKLTQSDIAKSMGVSQSYIANKLRLLTLSPAIENIIISRGLSERHARALLRLKDEREIALAVDKISAMGLNVLESEALIEGMLPKKEIKIDYQLSHISDIKLSLEQSISSALAAMRRLGNDASQISSFHDNKKYITICYEE